MSTKPILIGGKLKLKGASSGSTNKKRKASEAESAIAGPSAEDKKPQSVDGASAKADSKSDSSKADSFLTEAQRRHKQKRLEQETKAAKHLVQTTYRDRIEEFNLRLATTTEHNDIPRISAAGNG